VALNPWSCTAGSLLFYMYFFSSFCLIVGQERWEERDVMAGPWKTKIGKVRQKKENASHSKELANYCSRL